MRIDLKVLDTFFCVSSMLLEIPNFAENQFNVNTQITSKVFKQLIEKDEQKAFYLVAENYRDNIISAARKLNKSNWRAALDEIFKISFIARLPEFENGDLQ